MENSATNNSIVVGARSICDFSKNHTFFLSFYVIRWPADESRWCNKSLSYLWLPRYKTYCISDHEFDVTFGPKLKVIHNC